MSCQTIQTSTVINEYFCIVDFFLVFGFGNQIDVTVLIYTVVEGGTQGQLTAFTYLISNPHTSTTLLCNCAVHYKKQFELM